MGRAGSYRPRPVRSRCAPTAFAGHRDAIVEADPAERPGADRSARHEPLGHRLAVAHVLLPGRLDQNRQPPGSTPALSCARSRASRSAASPLGIPAAKRCRMLSSAASASDCWRLRPYGRSGPGCRAARGPDPLRAAPCASGWPTRRPGRRRLRQQARHQRGHEAENAPPCVAAPVPARLTEGAVARPHDGVPSEPSPGGRRRPARACNSWKIAAASPRPNGG